MKIPPKRRLFLLTVVLALLLSAQALAVESVRHYRDGGKNTVRVSETDAANAIRRSEVIVLPALTGLGTAVTLDMPASVTAQNPVRVKFPVARPGGSLVVVRVRPDGGTAIIRDCALSEDGVIFRVAGDQTVMLLDNSKSFRDKVPAWARDYVDFVTSREIFNGMGDGTFDPNGRMSRAMVVKALYELEGAPKEPEHNAFSDTAGKWYHDSVNWAYGVGVAKGENGSFNGSRDVTRQEFVTMLCRYAQVKGYPIDNAAPLNAFSDAYGIAKYARPAIQWAVADGLIVGDEGRIEPKDSATRAEVAAVMTRFINRVIART